MILINNKYTSDFHRNKIYVHVQKGKRMGTSIIQYKLNLYV